jgi:hypothetical protein
LNNLLSALRSAERVDRTGVEAALEALLRAVELQHPHDRLLSLAPLPRVKETRTAVKPSGNRRRTAGSGSERAENPDVKSARDGARPSKRRGRKT